MKSKHQNFNINKSSSDSHKKSKIPIVQKSAQKCYVYEIKCWCHNLKIDWFVCKLKRVTAKKKNLSKKKKKTKQTEVKIIVNNK